MYLDTSLHKFLIFHYSIPDCHFRPVCRTCPHCVDTVRFKILKGRLYVKGDRHPDAEEHWHLDVGG